MWKELVPTLLLFTLLVENIFASGPNPHGHECFFDQEKKFVEEFGGLTNLNCTIINDTNSMFGPDDGCSDSIDPDFKLGSVDEKFELSIGEGKNKGADIVVLNVTISNIAFHKLRIKHHNLASGKGEIYWQTIEFVEDQIPEKLFVFSSVWESHRTKIQFFAERRDYKFFKEYHFIPNSTLDTFEESPLFAYVDTTFKDRVDLHIQPCNNITKYIVKFQSANAIKETFCGPQAINISADDLPYTVTDFPEDANYKFCLTAVDNNGKHYNATSGPTFCMRQSRETLLRSILLSVAIPVLIFLFLYTVYILFRRKVLDWLKKRRPYCLLVYSATHDAHIDVMIKLAEYLIECEINAMIDVLNIPHDVDKNPTHWCDGAFQRANTVIVVASPECKNAIVTKTIYQYLDTHAMNLIHEERRHQNKKYLAVQLPYCKESDMPKEASAFRLLEIPKDLKKLINKIHRTKYTEVYKIPDERMLIDCIKSAKKRILSREFINEP